MPRKDPFLLALGISVTVRIGFGTTKLGIVYAPLPRGVLGTFGPYLVDQKPNATSSECGESKTSHRVRGTFFPGPVMPSLAEAAQTTGDRCKSRKAGGFNQCRTT
jgi:hypothetical protein